MIKKILTAAAFGVAALGAQANTTNLLTNGSFEGIVDSYAYNGTPPSVATNYGAVPVAAGTVAGWDGTFVSIAASSSPWQTPGSLSGFDSSFGNYVAGVQADGALSQLVTLDAGTYQLSWFDANRGNNQNFEVLFNGVELGSYTTTTADGWKLQYLTFTLSAQTTGLLTFQGETIFGQSDSTTLIDKASLMAVPEPGSLALMLAGVTGLLAWRRRAQV
jgi:hypothetical protein